MGFIRLSTFGPDIQYTVEDITVFHCLPLRKIYHNDVLLIRFILANSQAWPLRKLLPMWCINTQRTLRINNYNSHNNLPTKMKLVEYILRWIRR
jgi:hypothetical protein